MTLWEKVLTGLGYAAIAVWIAAAILGELGLCDLYYVNIVSAAAQPQPDDCEVRSRLLMEAMDFVGVCRPEDAALVWAEGLKARSAALQYAVMSKPLKEEYALQLQETAPNWVTGISSPFVSSYQIIRNDELNSTQKRITLEFFLATSTGPAGSAKAELDIAKEGCFFRIVHIEADEALFPYTRFRPD